MARAAQWAVPTAASAEARLGQTRPGWSVWYVRLTVPGTSRALRERLAAGRGGLLARLTLVKALLAARDTDGALDLRFS